MKIEKYIDISGDYEIDITPDDIWLILDSDSESSMRSILHAFQELGQFLKGIPDARIADMTDIQKTSISEFLLEQARRYVQIDVYDLGLEIISGMKASAYSVSIEEGMDMALEDTIPFGDENGKQLEWIETEKKRLEEQAMFIANIALKKLGFTSPDKRKED